MLITPWIKDIIKLALSEDIGTGDVTTELVISSQTKGIAEIISREEGIIAGINICREVFRVADESVICDYRVNDGQSVEAGAVILEVSGPVKSILAAERTALNFLQHLSGIATLTRNWSVLIADYDAQLVDTRKTTPGLRQLEKYAVRVGGGRNHRMGLFGGVLIKENHITAAGGISEAIKKARAKAPVTLKIEIEVTDIEELREAIDSGADLIMLDNMDNETIKKAVEINNGRSLLEASGNITGPRLKEVAATGVNYISSGALTQSSRALNMSLLLREVL